MFYMPTILDWLDYPRLRCSWLGVFDCACECDRSAVLMIVVDVAMSRLPLNTNLCLTSTLCGLSPVLLHISKDNLGMRRQTIKDDPHAIVV